MQISIIVAVSENGVIGRDNQLIWRLPDDLKRFKQLTLGHPMIMGRKTFESIGKPLPGRKSIVITRNKDFSVEGVTVVHALSEALKEAAITETDEVFIIGGGDIYRQSLSAATRIYLTKVHTTTNGDTFFQIPDPESWVETETTFHTTDERHAFEFEFVDLARKKI